MWCFFIVDFEVYILAKNAIDEDYVKKSDVSAFF